MVDENRTGFGQVDIVDDDNMVRLPRQRIVDMYKKAISRVRVLEANEGPTISNAKFYSKQNTIFIKLFITRSSSKAFDSKTTTRFKCYKTKLDETQSELNAWKFTPDSNTGKRLMAKCRLLYQENEELGKTINSGRVAKLEAELALQKNFNEEVKKSQSEMDGFLENLDEDVEGMQSVIYLLQNELQKYKTSVESPTNTENKEYIPKVVNGVKKDVITKETIPSMSTTEIPTKVDNVRSDSKIRKHKKPKDSKNSTDSQSNLSKVKKAQSVSVEDTNQSNKNPKVHNIKHKSEDSKNEKKLKKSDKRQHSNDEVVQKKSKSDQPKNTEILTPDVVNDLQNGS